LALIKPLSRRYYLTRDCAPQDADGSSPFAARPDDVTNTAGCGIRLLEIERVLTVHLAVAQGAGVVVPDRSWGETLHAL
jgi:acyl-coenzyme A synthetase/AMP-(fatty) acid ligase